MNAFPNLITLLRINNVIIVALNRFSGCMLELVFSPRSIRVMIEINPLGLNLITVFGDKQWHVSCKIPSLQQFIFCISHETVTRLR